MSKKSDVAVASVVLSEVISSKILKQSKDSIADGANLGFEITAKLDGRLTKGLATEKLATCALLNEAIVCELVRRLGVTRKAFEVALFEIAMEAHVAEIPIREKLIAADPSLLTIVETIKRDVISKLPKKPVAGSIEVVASLDFTKLKVV